MKNLRHLLLVASLATLTFVPSYADEVKFGIANFKACIAQSKVGKQEQASFEALNKQMVTILEEKAKVLQDLEAKAQDPDYLDSLSPEAETTFKRNARALEKEFTQLRYEYEKTSSEANYKIIQKLDALASKAAKEVKEEQRLAYIARDEAFFYYDPAFDVSNAVAAKMDAIAEKENKEGKGE